MNALLTLIASAIIALAPVPPDSTLRLPRSSPEEQGVSSGALLAFIEAADEEIDAMHSFMLVRNGHVVAEGWWGPYGPETPHVFYSLSKSFTSTAVGLAIDEGHFSLHDPVISFFPEDTPADPSQNLRSMRVKDLLRMNTGHQTEPGFGIREDGAQAKTWVQRFLEHPVPFKPGTHFLYNTPATYMLSAIVQKMTGTKVLDYLRPRLFEPLGIEHPAWDESPEGITAGGFGMRARTEDIAKFGQLYLQKGMWNGRRLLPAGWAEEATALQTSNGSSPASDWDQGYGYQFWRSRNNAYRGDGAFGQYCLVLPEHDAVVAITSGVSNMQAVLDLIWEKLLPAFESEPLQADAAARRALETKLAGLTMRLPGGQSTSPLAEEVSGTWYTFGENDRGIEALALDFSGTVPALLVRTAEGEVRTPVGIGSWEKSEGTFTNGAGRMLSVPASPLVAASGAWAADDTFIVKLALYETPYYSTLNLRFDGDRLVLDSKHNVAFGPTEVPQLVGQAGSGE